MISKREKDEFNKNRSNQNSVLKTFASDFESDDDDIKGRSVIQEVDYSNMKQASKEIRKENYQNMRNS